MPVMSKSEEMELFEKLRDTRDPGVREQLVHRYLPLARHAARRFQGRHASFDDLFQVASYALLKAIDGFDADRGLAFTSYAVPTISGELKRHARDTGWAMRVPRSLQERALEVESVVNDLTQAYGRSPAPARIAEELGITSEEVLEAIDASTNHTLESLDSPISHDDETGTRIDTIGSTENGYSMVEDADAVAPALRELPERERMILQLRFGEELPQSEIARRLGISQMHVSRLLRRTLDRLAETVDSATARI